MAATEAALAPMAGCSRAGHQPRGSTWWPLGPEHWFWESGRLGRDLASVAYWLCDFEQKVFNKDSLPRLAAWSKCSLVRKGLSTVPGAQ